METSSTNSGQATVCCNCKTEFSMDADELGFYEKMNVPTPALCPLCRQQARMLFRNFKTLYKRPSSLSGKSIVSMYAANVPFPVYDAAEWWGDTWDATTFEREIDWSRPFFEQLKELITVVPRMALMNTKSTDCDYANMAVSSKNCYLVFGCVDNEDCDYGHITWNSRDTLDSLYVFKNESCYECTDVLGSNKVFYSQESENCADSIGLFDCRSCTDCIGCVGLNSKSYHIFNENVGREAYKQFLEEHPIHDPATVAMIFEKREELRRSIPQRAFFGSHNVDVSGNHIYYSKNIKDSFDIKGGEDSRYCYTMRKAVNTYDAGFSPDLEESYQCLTSTGARIIGGHVVYDSHDVYYSDYCYGSHNLFGCAGLRQKSYCIFNKQYSKEEYEALVPKLIEHMKAHGEWGGFFPQELSPFGYNESIVSEYMPLSKEQALAQGYQWRDDIPATHGQGTIAYADLPKDPDAYTDELTKQTLTCANCEKNYRLIPYEVSFYTRMKLALPDKCFNCRHEARMQSRNPRQLWDAKCASCSTDMKTSYPPEKQAVYKLYCEACYQREMM